MSENKKLILSIETSCDDTSIAIVKDGGFVLGTVTANQDLQHKDFGGVVPEVAGRNHLENILPLIERCLEECNITWESVTGIAVTNRPGLVGSLLVGIVTAKTLAFSKNKKLIGVNHLEGHLLAPFLSDKEYSPSSGFDYPYIALAVSGGHTQIYLVKNFGEYLILGKTLDDAAGEAFDKFAKVLGLGFPGGPLVDKYSKGGDPNKYEFPKALPKELKFSFSGVKSSAGRLLETMSLEQKKAAMHDLCASYQETIVDTLISKLEMAAKQENIKNIVITGGVSANSRLRKKATDWAAQLGYQLLVPPVRYCTDNAAMIGFAGLERLKRGQASDLSLSPSPKSYSEDFI